MAVDKTVNQQTQDSAPTTDDFLLAWDTGSGASKKIAISDLLLISNPYKVRATKSATQTGLVTDTYTDITFDTETYDTGNNFASNSFTAPINGYYLILAKLVCISSVVGAIQGGGIAILKNGATVTGTANYYDNGVSYDNMYLTINDLIPLVAGDVIKMQGKVIVSSGTGQIVGGPEYTLMAISLHSKA